MDRTPDKRQNLIRAADTLFYHQGLDKTSLADIAAAARVPLGNVYYYFKTRADLVKAVSEARLEALRQKRREWEKIPSPRARLLQYVESFEASAEENTAHGCRIGGFCLEANKAGGAIAEEAAAVLRSTLDWVERQFRDWGFPAREARSHASTLVSARQGSILLAQTFKDPKFIRLEIERLKQWLGALPAGTRRKPS